MILKDEIGCDKSINHIFKIYNKCSIIIMIIIMEIKNRYLIYLSKFYKYKKY